MSKTIKRCECCGGLDPPAVTILALLDQLQEFREELGVTNKLLKARDKVMEAIPPCPLHGHQCVPHALRWIEKRKSGKESNEREEAKTEGQTKKRIVVTSELFGEGTVCDVVECERCQGTEFIIYDGGGISGCAGGVFATVCSGCGNIRMLLDDAA